VGLRVQLLEAPAALLCPCCGARPGHFLPIPDSYIEECRARGVRHPLDAWETLNLHAYLCPGCGATDRDRLQTLFLQDRLQPGMRVLEIAPSPPVSNWLRSQLEIFYRSADLEMPSADDKVDVTDMRLYAAGAFDVVICSHVLEHVADDLRAMREIRRVLTPGGEAALLVPISLLVEDVDEDPLVADEAERWRRFGQGDHVRVYGRGGFERRLSQAGFKVERFQPREPSAGLSASATLYLGK
jgi:SAM-dependent methyltransferase